MMPIISLLLFGNVYTVLAAEPVTAEIPVSVEIKDAAELPESETFTVTLRPVDGAVMPAGAGEEAKLTFSAAGKKTFPVITFEEPGDYRYILEQELSDTTVCRIDETKYEILVRVFADEKTGGLKSPVLMAGTGGRKAEEFKFVNSVHEPGIVPPSDPKEAADENGGGTTGGGRSSGGGGGGSSRGGSSRSETSGGGPAASADSTPAGDVLGAVRDAAESIGNGVLGAARDPVGSVLGAARAAKTGDYSLMIGWLIALLLAVGGIFAWTRFFLKLRRNGRS